jgi:threonine synthase
VSISSAIDAGLAPDGGLYVPELFPQYQGGSFDIVETLAPFFEGDPLAPYLKEICENALNFPIPLRKLTGKFSGTAVLELYHGPTAAFKDVGARFLAECQSRLHQDQRTVLVATSGDTGGAVAAAFFGRKNFNVIILFPKGMVSARQLQQLTCWGGNVKAFAVKGTFDDCQRMAKEAFADPWWKSNTTLTSANSINIGRLIPQMTYYARASIEYQKEFGKSPGFIIPSGNLGNAVAALWAKKMGFPIGKIIMATNANKSVPDYLRTGVNTPHTTINTLANAMDVGNPSNLERAIDLYPNIEDFRKDVESFSVSDEEIKSEIIEGAKEGNIWCPHTATAAHVRKTLNGDAWIMVSTAHPAKFETIVEPLIGKTVEIPNELASLLSKPSHYEEIDADLKAIPKSALKL